LFSKPGVTGLAVILERAAAGLGALDFDQPEPYLAWAQKHPEDVAVLPTVWTHRGYRVYGRLEDEAFVKLEHGELRGSASQYIVLPPSRHPEGPTYEWIIPLPDHAELLPLLPQSLTQVTREQPKEDSGDPGHPRGPTHTVNSLVSPLVSARNEDIERAIVTTIPTGIRQRRMRLFDLARILKAIIPDATAARLRAIARMWHGRALPVIRTKPFDESWNDFRNAWACVRHPAGQSFRAAADAVDAGIIPPICDELGYDGDLRRLAALCWHLQRQWGDRPFPLGCRQAAGFLDVDKTKAGEFFKTLQFDEVLELAKKGTKVGNKASEWRFIGAK
jgi:hypothetical protein